MAYERTNWQNGDVISSEKLNKMEAGIEYACSLEHEVEDPTEGQVLKYDAEKGKFVNEDVAIETNIQNPTDGQTLKYDAESGKWVNAEGGGSSTLVVNATTDEGTGVIALDKTWQEIYDACPNVVLLTTLPFGSMKKPLIGASSVGHTVTFAKLTDTTVNIDKYTADSEAGYPQKGGTPS